MSEPWFHSMKTVSWWFDWTDLQFPSPQVIDRWQKRLDVFQSIGVNTVVTFGFHFRWDWLNYWERYHSILRHVTELCHDRGIRIVDHHSNQLTHHIKTEADRLHIVTYQDHHLPLFPDSWENQQIHGRALRNWRILSRLTGEPVYLNNYKAEAFCPSNPEYREEYALYVKKLIAETGIDGLMSDDSAFHGDMYSCGCPACQQMFRECTGRALPASGDNTFWNHFEDSLFQQWVAMRYRSISEFYRIVKDSLPEGMPLWACSCSDSHPYKVRQGCAMEQWAGIMDIIFVEIYHALDFVKDRKEILTELAVASSLAQYHHKKALILCYSDFPEVLQKWSDLCADFGCLTWFCRQVRKTPVIYEDEILKNRYPSSENREKPYQCGIVYSLDLKNRIGNTDLHYYEAFSRTVLQAMDMGMRPQIIFDSARPATPAYDVIYAPCCDELSANFRQWLDRSGCRIIPA